MICNVIVCTSVGQHRSMVALNCYIRHSPLTCTCTATYLLLLWSPCAISSNHGSNGSHVVPNQHHHDCRWRSPRPCFHHHYHITVTARHHQNRHQTGKSMRVCVSCHYKYSEEARDNDTCACLCLITSSGPVITCLGTSPMTVLRRICKHRSLATLLAPAACVRLLSDLTFSIACLDSDFFVWEAMKWEEGRLYVYG